LKPEHINYTHNRYLTEIFAQSFDTAGWSPESYPAYKNHVLVNTFPRETCRTTSITLGEVYSSHCTCIQHKYICTDKNISHRLVEYVVARKLIPYYVPLRQRGLGQIS